MYFFKRSALAATMSVAAAVGYAETRLIQGEAGPKYGVREGTLQLFADQVTERSAGDNKNSIQWDGAIFNDMAAYEINELLMNNPDAWVSMRSWLRPSQASPGSAV